MPQLIEVPGYGQVEFPDGMTDDQIASAIKANMPNAMQPQQQAMQAAPQQAAQQPQTQWGDVPLQALKNIPSSAWEVGKGLYQAVRHPVDTAQSTIAAAQGGVVNALPDAAVDWLNKVDPGQAQKRADVSKVGDVVGHFYKDRYGSVEGLKKTLATDPVGSAMDVSTILSLGAAAAPNASRLAAGLRKAATATNPINAVTYAAGKAIPAVGGFAADVIGGLGTHTGGEALKQAARSGMEGGESARLFTQNMRGNVPMTDVLDVAKANLEKIGRDKSAAYRAGMAQVSGDKSVLNFGGIDNAIKDAADAVTFKGQVKNAKAAELLQNISDEVNKWKTLNPKEFHTPEGLDALKQRIGALVESVPLDQKTAGMVGKKIYNAVKSEIVKQAPVYADTMKGYTEASDQIKEIERALSLNPNASVDTAMRKLQSLTRNNVNTNYGNRLDLAKQLEAAGGKEIMPALAGQALNSWTPRGIGNAVAGVTGMGAASYGGPVAGLGTLAVQSPRLMGEAALKSGQLAKALKAAGSTPAKLGIDPATLANLLYQSGRLPQDDSSPLMTR